MKKNLLTCILAVTISAMMLAGCGNNENTTKETTKETTNETTTTQAPTSTVAPTQEETTSEAEETTSDETNNVTKEDSSRGHISSIEEIPYVIPTIIDEETGEEGVPGVFHTDVKLEDVLAAKSSALTFTYKNANGQSVEWNAMEELKVNASPDYDEMGEEELGKRVAFSSTEAYYEGISVSGPTIVDLYNELYDTFGVPIRARAVKDEGSYYIELNYVFADSTFLSINIEDESIRVEYTTKPWIEG